MPTIKVIIWNGEEGERSGAFSAKVMSLVKLGLKMSVERRQKDVFDLAQRELGAVRLPYIETSRVSMTTSFRRRREGRPGATV